MDEEEIKERKFEKVLLDEDVELRWSRKTWEFMLSMVHHLLSKKATSLEEDEELLRQLDAQELLIGGGSEVDKGQKIKKRCAIIFRMDEKRILRKVEERIQQELAK